MKNPQQPAVTRAALYIRVSTEEQAMRGYSLEAQRETLEAYAKEHAMLIVDFYQDEGRSARKPYRTRPEFMRLLHDVEAGKIDRILFIKLDRWFRSVGDYYEVQKILDKHRVPWQAVLEDYETVTSSGQFKVTIMLAVAQNEADRTSERIGVVFDSKIRHGTMVSGMVPFGYRLNEEKRMDVVPERAAVVLDAYEHFKATVSQRSTLRYIRETYHVNWCYATLNNIFRNRLYTGYYERNGRVNPNFCPAIISPELFESVQKLLDRNVKAAPSGRVYLFSSLLVCAECGHKLAVQMSRNYVYYRCPHYFQRALCAHNHVIGEKRVEAWLFEHLGEAVERCRAEWDAREAERKRATAGIDRAAIKRKLARLEDLYVNDLIDLESYRRRYEEYAAQLAEQPAPTQPTRPNFDAALNIVSQDYRAVYDTLTREEKRTLWHSVIREVHINNSLEVTRVVFL